MAATIITTEDLHEFKYELLEEIKEIVQNSSGIQPKKWLKSPEIRELLKYFSWNFTKLTNQWYTTIHQSWWNYILRLR